MGVRPAIHLGTPLFHQGIDGFQAIRRLEGQAYDGKYPQPMQSQRLLQAFRQAPGRRLVSGFQVPLQAVQRGLGFRIRRALIRPLEPSPPGGLVAFR